MKRGEEKRPWVGLARMKEGVFESEARVVEGETEGDGGDVAGEETDEVR